MLYPRSPAQSRPTASSNLAGEAPVALRHRIRGLWNVLDSLRERPEEAVDILTQISPFRTAQLELQSALAALSGALEETRTYQPRRVERMAVFMPSNMLIYSYVLYLLIPSLYTQRITFRPSSHVLEPTHRLHELLAPIHGLPLEMVSSNQNYFRTVHVARANVVVFTGTYPNAESIRTALRPDQLLLFFGQGINPFVVAPGADIEAAVEDAIQIRMLNSGQDCLGPDVYYVHETILGEFLGLLTKRLGDWRYGPYSDPDADYGPLYYSGAFRNAADYLLSHRRRIVQGGRVDLLSQHIEPTVLVSPFAKKQSPVELFSPIFNVVTYDGNERLRDRLGSRDYTERALGATVYGDDPALIQELGERHTVTVDKSLLDIEDGNRPFGGYGIQANYISHHGRLSAEPILLSKAVAECQR